MVYIGALRAQKYRFHCFHLPSWDCCLFRRGCSLRLLQNSQGARAWLEN